MINIYRHLSAEERGAIDLIQSRRWLGIDREPLRAGMMVAY